MSQMSKVDCKYGAPMGRASIGEKPEGTVRLFQVVLSDGYDDGGAYWGVGKPLWCVQGDGFERTVRMDNARQARDWFQFQYGPLEFAPLDVERDWLPVFLWAYTETALEDSDDDDGVQLSKNYGIDDIDPASFERMNLTCLGFLSKARIYLEKVARLEAVSMWSVPTGAHCSMIEYAAHDFWLTQNGSGAGFWDGDWPDEVEKGLTKIAQSFGGSDLYAVDGKVYL